MLLSSDKIYHCCQDNRIGSVQGCEMQRYLQDRDNLHVCRDALNSERTDKFCCWDDRRNTAPLVLQLEKDRIRRVQSQQSLLILTDQAEYLLHTMNPIGMNQNKDFWHMKAEENRELYLRDKGEIPYFR